MFILPLNQFIKEHFSLGGTAEQKGKDQNPWSDSFEQTALSSDLLAVITPHGGDADMPLHVRTSAISSIVGFHLRKFTAGCTYLQVDFPS